MRNQLMDLIRETRAPEPKRKETVASRWDQLLGNARTQNNAAQRSSPENSATTSTSTLLSDLHEDIYSSSLPPITLRLRPTLGRTVDGIYGDPTRGFRLLERKCHENNVKSDMRSQEKHVRRGQRRKNIRILRWRKLFMEGFRSELGTIRKMRKQGW
ncbi:hypothetical protein AYO21_01819 [Fonsecaea monophora]|uniref:Unplaced genomic scaffold supercont1.3, whole genome shotgun sequence n=2 Tax=Fonsecaea TaxID=40354 RepID=A0A0D2GR79_9EURO|nr:uncharacterized protein Z517_04073 [Fonsecaea pedrosoi CBS 271.37]XP_022515919.1 hypothetical protein AYO21_01819 [Fonsecaea monophora]KAH0831621.1 hypothetical protein FOPE_02969 [Fonsecaea pedrosoi]KIW81050.1 hypothetical protein Z517_04073 [Fonsecaea pedrosoi CBS 271.37]OAG43967.1 hypothetical protein AYO21_01819 [Fonsecaea monophora]